jgi:CelD/BcsL family acetyltransferase involved in cellulose biosynthesis
VLAWWHAFGRGPLALATARRDGRLVAALPFVRRGHVLSSASNWHTPETGVLAVGREEAAALGRSIAEHRVRRVSLAFLDRLDERVAAFRDAIDAAGYRTLERTLLQSPVLELTGDWPQFEAALRSSQRSELRRLRRRLEESGAVVFEVHDGRARLDELLEEVMHVEALGWKGAEGTAMASQEATRSFYREMAAWAAPRGWLRVHVLRLDEAPIAVSLAIVANGVHYGLKMGYDPAHRKLGPGTLLLHELVRDAHEHGLVRVEMLGADDPYKRKWCPQTRTRVGLQAFAPSLAGHAERLAYSHGRPLARRLGAQRLLGRLAPADGPRL